MLLVVVVAKERIPFSKLWMLITSLLINITSQHRIIFRLFVFIEALSERLREK